MVTIKRIGVSSAMKVGALVYALSFAVFGLFILAFQSLAVSAVSNAIARQGGQNSPAVGNGVLAGGLAVFCIFYVGGIIFALIAGGIGGALLAIFYNLVSNWVGGLEVQLSSGTGKLKREDEMPSVEPLGKSF